MPEFRRASALDIGALVDLRLDFMRIVKDGGIPDEAAWREELSGLFARDLASGALLAWVCEEGDGAGGSRVIGTSGLRLGSGAAGEGEILNVFTVPERRCRGIASALLDFAIEEARARGLKRLRLQPTDDGRPLYEAAGFRGEGEEMALEIPAKGGDMRLIDLSHPIRPGMPAYPGTEGPRFEGANTIERDGFEERLVTMYSHTGTHMDAPAHLIMGAARLDELPIGRFAGRAVLLDARGLGAAGAPGAWPSIGADMVSAIAPALAGAAFLVLRTGWDERWGDASYYEGFPTLSEEAAAAVAAVPGLSAVAVDAISVDPVGARELPVHRILLGAGLVIVENLRGLDAVRELEFELACLPLPLAEADGAPVRAVAILR